MDATDEAIAREQEDKENTTATLTRKGKFYLLSKLAVCSFNTRLNNSHSAFPCNTGNKENLEIIHVFKVSQGDVGGQEDFHLSKPFVKMS